MRLLLSAAIVVLYVVTKSNAAPNTTDVESSTDHATSSSSTDADIDAKRQAGLELVIDLARNFSIKYFHLVAVHISQSETFSPLLDFLALSLFSYATQGRIRANLTEILGFADHDREILELGFQTLIDRLNNYSHVELCVRNEIQHSSIDSKTAEFADLTHQTFRLSMGYDRTLSQIKRMPFSSQYSDIFRWMLRHPFNSESLHVIVNSVRFNGQWKIGFDPSLTEGRLFWMDHTDPIYVRTMNVKGLFRYGHLPEINIPFIELPYKSNGKEDGISMFVIRSNDKQDYEQLMRKLGRIDLKRLILDNTKKPVNLYMPAIQSKTRMSINLHRDLAITNETIPKKVVNDVEMNLLEHRSMFSSIPVTSYKTRKTRSGENNEVILFEVNRPFVAIVATTGANIIELSTSVVSGG